MSSLTSRRQTVQAAPSKKKKFSREREGKIRRESANGREKEKKEKKGKEEKKKEEKMDRAVLKVFCSTPSPPHALPSIAPSSDVAREKHNSHKGGTREKHNSYKRKTIRTKRQLTISRQTSCNDNQTLTLHHAWIPITPKKGKNVRSMSTITRGVTICKKVRALGKSCNPFQFSIKPHYSYPRLSKRRKSNRLHSHGATSSEAQ